MKNNNEKGFTLVEIIVIIAIMALLLIPIASLMISNSKGIISANQNTDLQEKALQIMSAFRTNCLYTSNVESLTLNGISSEDTIFTVDLDNGFDQDSDGASFVMTVRKPTDAGYIRTVYTYDNSTNEFSIVDDGKSMLKVSDIIVSLQPIGRKNTTQFTFREAYGVKVTVELARDLDRISKKITLKDLSNAFYFRNSGVDINDLYMTPSPESSLPMPDPDNGDNVATPTPSATITPTDQPGSGGISGEGSSSGEGGSTGGSGSGEGGGSGGSTGDSGSGEGSSSGGSTGGSGSDEGGGSSSSTSPVPSSSPATPTVVPTDDVYDLSFDYSNGICTLSDSSGIVASSTLTGGSVQINDKSFSLYNIAASNWSSPTSDSIYAEINILFTGTNTSAPCGTLYVYGGYDNNVTRHIYNYSNYDIIISNQNATVYATNADGTTTVSKGKSITLKGKGSAN